MELAKIRSDIMELIHTDEDQVLFINLGPTDGRGGRVISALGRPYSSIDAPLIVV
jgi:CRISPR-associated protein Cas2